MGPRVRGDDSRKRFHLLALAQKLLDRDAKLVRLHAIDDAVALDVQLLLDWAVGRTVDQRLGRGDRRRCVLRQTKCEFSRRRLSSAAGTTFATRPHANACAAEKLSSARKICNARRTPTALTTPTVPPPSGDTPSLA